MIRETHHRRRGIPSPTALVVAVAAVVASCANPGKAPPDPFETNRALWESTGLTDYDYELGIGCFCAHAGRSPALVRVRGDTVQSVTFMGEGGEPPDSIAAPFFRWTIDGLFSILAAARAREPDSLTMEFDPAKGYPRRVAIDESFLIADDETAYWAMLID